MKNEGGGFAANIYGAIQEKRCRTPFRILAFKIQGKRGMMVHRIKYKCAEV